MNKERELEPLSEDELVNVVSSLEKRIVGKLNEKLANKPEDAHYGGIVTYLFMGGGTAILLGNDGKYSFKFDMTGADMGHLTVEELIENYAEVTRGDFPSRDYSGMPKDLDDESFSRLLEERSAIYRSKVEQYIKTNRKRLLVEMVTKMEECLLKYR